MRALLRSIIPAVCCIPLFIPGCIYVKTHPAGIVPSSQVMASPDYDILGDAEGMSSSFTLLWAIPVTPGVSTDAAFASAIRSKGGDTLLGACIWSEKQIWILGTIETIYVKGTVARSIQSKAKKEK